MGWTQEDKGEASQSSDEGGKEGVGRERGPGQGTKELHGVGGDMASDE